MKIDKKELENALQLCVDAGMMRKFKEDGEWKYIDNRVPPSEIEIEQDRKLKAWKKPDEAEVQEKVKMLEKKIGKG